MHAICRVVALAAAAASGTAAASAQSYPSRAIDMIVAAPAGGITDTMARALQNEMSRALGQTVNIGNKDGASGTVALADLTRAAADGHTLAFTPNNPIAAQPLVQKVTYTPASFRYICLAYYTPLVLVAGPQAPFKTVEEFVSFAREKPENLAYGYPGLASQQHLAMLAVLNAIGAKAREVSFTSAAAALRGLFDGTVMAIVDTSAIAAATDFPVLAALSEERMRTLPDVRTMKELGYAATGFLAGGVIAPASISTAVADTLEKACAGGTASAEYKAVAGRMNIEARYLPAEDFRKLIATDWAANGEILARSGLAAGK
jgi:tripartite-type tricarboxylate transporter receptor subunit TctC